MSVNPDNNVDLPRLIWWQQFHNAELNQLIHKALLQNGEAQMAVARIAYTNSLLEQVKLSWLPNVSLLAGYSQFPILGNPGGIAMAYPAYIANVFQLYQQQKSAKEIYQAAIHAYNGIRLTVIAQTAATYFTLLAQHETLTIYKNLIADYQSYLNLVSSQYRHGLIAQDELDQVRSKVHLLHAQIDLTQHNIHLSENALHYLLNDNPGSWSLHTVFKQINSKALIPLIYPPMY